jgi:hypothetical protein
MSTHQNPSKHRPRHQLRRAVALVATILLAASASIAVLPAAVAYAGQWVEVSCVNPNQSQATSAGWTSFITGSPGYGSDSSTTCAPGTPMFADLSSDAAAPVGSGENLEWTAPGDSTLAGGSVYVSMYGDGFGYGASGTAIAYTPDFAYNASNVILQCAVGQPACSNASNDFSGVLTLPASRGGGFYLGAGCGGEAGASCDEGGSHGTWSLVQLWWADFLLTNNATPTATGLSGTLLNPGARGTQELIMDASDPEGPGIYNLTVQADGATLYDATPNSNGGNCSPVGESDGALMFDTAQPCPQNESVDLQLNTTGLLDGPHTLKVTLTDAAANASVVYDSTITTHNAPENTTAPTIAAPAPPTIGSTLTAHPGEWSAPNGAGAINYAYQWEDCNTEGNDCQPIPGAQNATYTPAPADAGHTLRATVTAADNDGSASATAARTNVVPAVETPPTTTTPGSGPSTATTPITAPPPLSSPSSGTPNGTPASENATLRLNGRTTITRSYTHRAFTLAGQLTDNQSQPIAEATLDVLQQIAGTTTLTPIAHTTTSPTGSFTLTVPAGPSRLIEIAYRALSTDTSYAATGRVHETVHAGARLTITTRSKGPTGTIILTGKVAGPVPQQGTIVELLVHYLNHWEPFRAPRTNNHGTFHVTYQFQGAIGHFPFRAEIPAGQANYPYTTGYSNTIDISTEP